MQIAQLQEMKLAGERAEKAQVRTKQLMDLIAKEMSWDNLKDDYISIYAETFTEEELKGIIKFYKTPIGQKFVKETPELMKRSMEISRKQMKELMPKIKSIIKDIEKWKEEKKQESSSKE